MTPHNYSTAGYISCATWVHWEIRRYLLATEAPGKYGTYGKEES